jgi:hypothetical protein
MPASFCPLAFRWLGVGRSVYLITGSAFDLGLVGLAVSAPTVLILDAASLPTAMTAG